MTKPIHQTYKIKAPVASVWKALIDPKQIDAWGGGPAKMNDKDGFKFSLWGGDIYGKNLEVVPMKKLKQEWSESKWKSTSLVTFLLSEKNNETIVELDHKNVPESSYKDIDSGWKYYYMGPLKEYVEKK